MDRREALSALSVGAMAAYGVGGTTWDRYQAFVAGRKGQPAAYRFFTAVELPLITMLADMVIPRDDKSGSATDAGSIEYMDFVLSEGTDRTQMQWHEGLTWFNDECQRRFQNRFTDCTEDQRAALLNDIAWPARASAAMAQPAQFFNRVRDLVCHAFFSSRMGYEDLGYIGNVFNPDWTGAPPEAAAQLGVSYAEWDAKYGTSGGSREQGAGPGRGGA